MQLAPSSQPMWRTRVPMTCGFLAVGLLVGGLGYWSVKTEIAGAIIASGQIQVETNRQVLQHPDGGVVGDVIVKDGDFVEAGQVVLRFDGTLIKSEQAILQGQLDELEARRARLEAERDGLEDVRFADELVTKADENADVAEQISGQRRLFFAKIDRLDREREQFEEQLVQLQAEVDGVNAQLASLAGEEELISAELADRESLFSRGLISINDISTLRRDSIRLSGEIGELQARIAQLKGSVAGVNIEILKIETARREEAITELRDIQVREIELAERNFSLLERLSKLEVRSPVSGLVFENQVFAVQSVVQAGQPIMYIIPQDRPLVVAARVEPIDIDQVHIGQDASLRFSSLDQRITPVLDGVVAKLSADAISDPNTGMQYFSIELVPGELEIAKLGDQVVLPGMPVEVFIRTDERTPLDYLVSPLMDYFARAMRG
ncbi:MAG: HlyD family type I secretion periplasmic adaptor subunit [Pseudomonadota bacterium]